MNENNILNQIMSFKLFGDNLLDNEGIFQGYPIVSTTLELENKIANGQDVEIFLTERKTLDDFLREKFNEIGLIELMKVYTKKHFGKALYLPMVTAPKVGCLFCNSDNPDLLSGILTEYQQTIKTGFFGSIALNLHTDDISKFTLLHAKFSLQENESKFSHGYHYETKNFHFFIQSSIQGDLAVVYQEL